MAGPPAPSGGSRSSQETGGQAAISFAEQLPLSSTATSASAAFARSLLLFLGLMFRRPSKLFRPNRVDTWAGLRQLATSANQSFSPAFIRDLLKRRGGPLALTLALLPPLTINTTLGFLLFTSHSAFSLALARLSFFQRKLPVSGESSAYAGDSGRSVLEPKRHLNPSDDIQNAQEQEYEETHLTLQTLLQGPSFVPRHPTLLSALAGAGAGVLQGMAFTPIENIVRFVHQSTTSVTAILARILHLNLPAVPAAGASAASPWEALKNLVSSDAWKRSPSWWTGWRWIVARDALSYSCFFAAFDITRRLGLRVKALFGGNIQPDWQNFVSIDWSSERAEASQPDVAASRKVEPPPTPTVARLAQAGTIIAGGVTASILAEIVGRPFRTCQRLKQAAKEAEMAAKASGTTLRSRPDPILETLRTQGIRPFIRPDTPYNSGGSGGTLKRIATRVGWRALGVGPWGLGFLVWAWVGGEV